MKTILEQTGWKRVHPQMLCPFEYLNCITEYDFDLSNSAFASYVQDRIGIEITDEHLSDILLNWSDERFLSDSKTAKSIKGYIYSQNDLHAQLRSIKLQRARIQDCWEIYNSKN